MLILSSHFISLCYYPKNAMIVSMQLHRFSDALLTQQLSVSG